MKICTGCKQEKSLEEFYNRTSAKDGKMNLCKVCSAAYNKKWQQDNPEKARERWRAAEKKSRANNQTLLKQKAKRYGISFDEIQLILEKKCCDICGRTFGQEGVKNANIDHCHDTGKVRGVLCTNCNTGIGNLRDDVVLLQKAIDYLNMGL